MKRPHILVLSHIGYIGDNQTLCGKTTSHPITTKTGLRLWLAIHKPHCHRCIANLVKTSNRPTPSNITTWTWHTTTGSSPASGSGAA